MHTDWNSHTCAYTYIQTDVNKIKIKIKEETPLYSANTYNVPSESKSHKSHFKYTMENTLLALLIDNRYIVWAMWKSGQQAEPEM